MAKPLAPADSRYSPGARETNRKAPESSDFSAASKFVTTLETFTLAAATLAPVVSSIMPWMPELNCPKHAADINATKPAMRAIFDRETLCMVRSLATQVYGDDQGVYANDIPKTMLRSDQSSIVHLNHLCPMMNQARAGFSSKTDALSSHFEGFANETGVI